MGIFREGVLSACTLIAGNYNDHYVLSGGSATGTVLAGAEDGQYVYGGVIMVGTVVSGPYSDQYVSGIANDTRYPMEATLASVIQSMADFQAETRQGTLIEAVGSGLLHEEITTLVGGH